MKYRWYKDPYGWVDCDETDTIIDTRTMEQTIGENQKAYVVNHRGYKAHVAFNSLFNLVWTQASKAYESPYSWQDIEPSYDEEPLLWVIREN